MSTIKVMLFQTHVNDKKHGLEFDKDRISYRHKTFDAIIANKMKDVISKEMAKKDLHYPLVLTLDNENGYFTKGKKFTRTDGTEGTKAVIVVTDIQAIEQGKFESKSLDNVVDELEEVYSQALGDDEE